MAKNSSAVKSQLKTIEQFIKDIRLQVQEERSKGPELKEDLSEKLVRAELKQAGIRKKIKSAKEQSKKRKKEIDEWKKWYKEIEQLDKMEELKQLNEEIAWRAADIAKKEGEINANYVKLLESEGECEQLKIRLEALNEVPADVGIDEDPRLKELLGERDALKAKLGKKA